MNESNQVLTRYLLGEMAAAEQTALEEKYFADSDLFDQLVEGEASSRQRHDSNLSSTIWPIPGYLGG